MVSIYILMNSLTKHFRNNISHYTSKKSIIEYYLSLTNFKTKQLYSYDLTKQYINIVKQKNSFMLRLFLDQDLKYSFDDVFHTALINFEPDIMQLLIMYNNHNIKFYYKFIDDENYDIKTIRYYLKKNVNERNKILNHIKKYNENINESLYCLPLSLTNIICEYVKISICDVSSLYSYVQTKQTKQYINIVKQRNSFMLQSFLDQDLKYSFDDVFHTALINFEPDIMQLLIMYNNHNIKFYYKFIDDENYDIKTIRYYLKKNVNERNKILNHIKKYNENINESLYCLPLSLTNIICDYVNISICDVLLLYKGYDNKKYRRKYNIKIINFNR